MKVFVRGLFLGLLATSSFAAQRGPTFPSHRYPTDRSWHLGYDFGWLTTASNFTGSLITDPLTANAKIRFMRHTLTAEFQPNRQASIGARVQFDSGKMTTSGTGAQAGIDESTTGFGDQNVWAEYRFVDVPGRSLGAAVTAKFPLYSNPAFQEVSEGSGSVVLLGDAQTDFTFMFTAEYWPGAVIRTQFDAGYTFRTDGYSPEVPYQFSLGLVTPKVDLTLRVRGNLSLGGAVDNPAEDDLRAAFANSRYALSQSPWTVNLEPHLEVWIQPQWAATFAYSHSLAGNLAPNYQSFQIGFMYRFAERVVNTRQTFRQVDIKTDQEAGKFQGEEQLNERKRRPEPRPANPRPIPDEADEEF